jgi:thioesterase domain-containing protein
MMLSNEALETAIHADFPIARAMSLRVKEASISHVTLEAPLVANTNHESTAFGGSVYSLAVLSCWALVSQCLQEWEFDVDYVVVQDGHIDYTIPVAGDFEATSSWASEREAQKFRTMLAKKGVARASLTSTVRSQGRDCAMMEGRFAARIEIVKQSPKKAVDSGARAHESGAHT